MDHSQNKQLFLWDSLLAWLQKLLTAYKVPFTVSLIAGFLSHTFTFTNKLINHDEACALFHKGATISSGRWLLELLDRIFPNMSMPWIYGVITLVFISVSVCIIIAIFRIRNRFLQGLLGGCFLAFPSLTGIFAFMFTSSSYGLSFFLAVLAVWLVTRWKPLAFLSAVGCMVLSLAIYQSFVSLSAALLVILVIQLLMANEDLASVIRKGFVSLGFLMLSLGIYYLSTIVVNRYVGIDLSEYATSRMEFSFLDIPAKAVLAYQRFGMTIFENTYGLVPGRLSKLLHLLLLACSGGFFLLWFFQQKKPHWGRCLLLLVMILLLPLAINCMFLFLSTDAIHSLGLYGFVSLYVLAAVLVDAQLTKENQGKWKAAVSFLCLHLIPLCLCIMIVINIYAANAGSLHLHLRYELAYSFYTSLMADVKMMPEYNENSKIAIAGFYPDPPYYYTHFTEIDKIMGVYGFSPSDYSKSFFLEYYLGYNVRFASDQEVNEIQQTQEFQDMPLYPYYGSMKWFGDTLVVKLS